MIATARLPEPGAVRTPEPTIRRFSGAGPNCDTIMYGITAAVRFAAEVRHAVLKLSARRSLSPAWSTDELRPVVREAIETFGPHRCMFGSNFPVDKNLPADKPAVSYPALWQAYDDLTRDLSRGERAAMFRQTAARTYRIASNPVADQGEVCTS